MGKREAIEFLKNSLNELTRLRGLDYDNEDYELWVSKIETVIKAGLDSEDYGIFKDAYPKSTPMRGVASEKQLQEHYQKRIRYRNTAIKKILQKYELSGIESETVSEPEIPVSPVTLYDALNLHPKVVESSRQLFKDGHYRDAIYRAFVEVNNFVKDKANNQSDGKRLMSTVFSLDNPIIKLNSLQTQSDKDEQEGFMFLFMGAMEGIRNPKAHENIIQNDPHRTLEYLGLASLLMKIAEEGHL